jgi:tyrosyl-tRNA synthetase
MNRKEIVTRNADEVVTDEELTQLLEKPNPSVYSGYETSGPVHLGHWISVRKLKDLAKADFEPQVLWADKHTYLNKKGSGDWSREETREWIDDMGDYWQATFESLGLEDAEFIRGRDFQETEEYEKDFEDLSTGVTLERDQRALSDLGGEDNLYVSQINYPLYQALDIAHLDADLAIGGTDQRKIHMLARDKLEELGYDKPTAMHYPLLTSLQGTGEKMSSSKPNTMFPLHASEDTVSERINDSYCTPEADDLVKENPLLQITNFFIFGADETLEIERPEKYGGNLQYEIFDNLRDDFESGELHPLDLKNGVADHVSDKLYSVRDRFADEPELLEPLEKAGYEMPEYVE